MKKILDGSAKGSADASRLEIQAGHYYEAENGAVCVALPEVKDDWVKMKWITGRFANLELWIKDDGMPVTEPLEYRLVRECEISIGCVRINPNAPRKTRDAVATLIRSAIEEAFRREASVSASEPSKPSRKPTVVSPDAEGGK